MLLRTGLPSWAEVVSQRPEVDNLNERPLPSDTLEPGSWRLLLRILNAVDSGRTHDRASRLRNHLVPMFTAVGLQNSHTGTWESPSVDLTQAAAQMNHLWVYIDRV